MDEDVLDLTARRVLPRGSGSAAAVVVAVAAAVIAVVVAAAGTHLTVDGSGTRSVPVHSQYQPLLGRPLV